MSSQTASAHDTRSVDEIRHDLQRTRNQMGNAVTGLVVDVHPQTIKNRAIEKVRSFIRTEINNAVSFVKDENGWRTDNIVKAGGTAAGSVAALFGIRALVRKGHKG